MSRRVAPIVAIALAVAIFSAVYSVTSALADTSPSFDRVVLVLAPTLSWDDLDARDTPTLLEMAEDGALGNINLRSRAVGGGGATGVTEGALTFSAGAWALADPQGPTAYSSHEYYEGGTAAEAFERMTGGTATGHDIVYLGMPRAQRANSGSSADPELGTLGQAIVQAGGATAAVGTSDSGYEVRGLWRSRPAALVAMDSDGRVRYGELSSDLLANDPDSPFGYATDLAALADEIDAVYAEFESTDGPQLLVVDPGDLQRAVDFEPDVSADVAVGHRRAAVRALDEVVASLRAEIDGDTALIVVPQVSRNVPGMPKGLAPVFIEAQGWSGYLTSSSTQRDGIVTNLDMTATVLELLGVEVPVQVLGNPMRVLPSEDGLERKLAFLGDLNDMAVVIDDAKWTVLNTYIALSAILFVLCGLVLARASRWLEPSVRLLVAVCSYLLILVLAAPFASWLMFAFDPRPTTMASSVGWYLATVAMVWAATAVLRATKGMRVAIGALALITSIMLMADQWVGAPWSYTSYFGYSPLLAARYYGIGNEGAAVLVGAAAVGMAMLLDEYASVGWTRHVRSWGIPTFGLLVTATAAAPFWGANVGVIAWGVVTFGVMWAMVNGVRFSWRAALLGFMAVVVLVAVFSYVDLTSGDGQTHLGRAWESAASGGVGELWTIVVRKAETNVRVLTRTNWTYILVVVLALLGFMRWRPWGDFAKALEENPRFSDGMAACLIGGVAAYLTEDSGIIIPALMMLYVGVGILALMLTRLGGEGAIDAGKERDVA